MKTAPDPKDVQEFQFKQSHTSQILDAFASIPTACNLLAADKKRGLLYVGQNNKIVVLKPGEDSDPEWKLELTLSVTVSKLMLNCDCSYLAVAPQEPSVLIYDVQALVANNLQLLYKIRISSSHVDTFVNDLRWNPTVSGMLCTIASDYTIGSFMVKEKKENAVELKALEKFNNVDALCAAWSPKGKQIVVGCKNGKIIQFKPDLTVARTIPGPNPYIGEVISILWISNFQFCAAYLGTEQKINVLIIDAPKGETNAIFTCYEDITFGVSYTEEEKVIPRYYFDHVPEWGLIIAASSNSSEVAVLGSTDAGVTWNQWQLVDSGRAELPLIRTTESYPVGLAIDKCSTRKLPWGADSMLPHPVPILHILATSGQLCSFHMVNLMANCPAINSPPTETVAPPLQLQSNVNLTDTSIVMNGFITSTPRPKQAENVFERPKPIPSGNLFEKFTEGNSIFAPSSMEKPKPTEQKTDNIDIEMKMEPAKEAFKEEIVKSDIKLVPIKETVVQEPVEQKTTVENENTDIRAYIEEHNLFEKELRNKLEMPVWECGTEEERRKLVDMSIIIDNFLRELKETTNSLSSDIAYLKALLLQSFAWVEETKSKNAATNDITARNCEDTNKISSLQKLYYYTQTQLTQASKILDLEWSDHKNQEMSRMKIPHLEFVYQNLILHNKIIEEERSKLEQLKKRWKFITRNNNIFGLNRSLSSLSITSSKSSASLPRNAGVIEARCKTIASKTLSFTQEKQIKLREHLSQATPTTIKPVNPSPIQHRLEATLSSLASLSTAADTKNRTEQSILKQPPASKPAAEKPKQQSPLASLNSIVAKIGANETNSASVQNKQPNVSITFLATPGNKAEKKSTMPITSTVPQSGKSKQDTISFNQVNTSTHALSNLSKSFPKVNPITFGTLVQKPEESGVQKTMLKESGLKPEKENVPTDLFKVENSLFSTGTLKDVLSETTTVPSSISLKFGLPVSATTATVPATKSDAAATFSFATPITTSAANVARNVLPVSQTSTQTCSFALKTSPTTTAFNLKIPSITTTTAAVSQPQNALNMGGLMVGLQTSNQTPTSGINNQGKTSYNTTFGTSNFQMSLGQSTTTGNQNSISLLSGTIAKGTATTAASVTIESVPSTESKVSSLATSSAASLFSDQTPTSTVVMFGKTPSTTSTFTTTTTTPRAQTTTTSSTMPVFGGFSASTTITTATTTATTPNAMSPFQTSLAKPTFGEVATNLSTTKSTTKPPPLFDGATLTSTTSVFDKPPQTMNTQFSSTSADSSTASTFGKPVISPSMPFGSSTNTSVFGQLPATRADDSVFRERTSIFGGNTQAPTSGAIFGGTPSSSANTFGGTPSSSTNTFGTPQKSIFDGNAQNSIFGSASNAASPSFFGGTMANSTTGALSPETSMSSGPLVPVSPFGGAVVSSQPMGLEQINMNQQPGFDQGIAFGGKPVFGSPPTFGTSKIFGGGFAMAAFGVNIESSTFGNQPEMKGNPAPGDNNMPKVFGSMGGSNTFESLANQPGGLSFSSLAQKNVTDVQKSPVFTSGSSFSTWR